MQNHILSLAEISDASAGGKAYGLSRLQLMGLAVPPAFVIRNARDDGFPDDLEQHYQALAGGSVAVRSSALGEDGAVASFAGQYDTVLNIRNFSELQQAIRQCVASADSDHARHYQQSQAEETTATMNVVVQTMVDARVAGVVFTADPVSARRDLLVIDVVAGLGEALVSGEATPDHYGVQGDGAVVQRHLTGTTPLLSDTEITAIAEQARAAATHEGQPLDLEWAIDHNGSLFWLQARPITTLPADLNEFDSTLPRPDDVLTISNVSEMMPGAVCPLTSSFTGWGIDYGLQHMQVAVGARPRIDRNWQVTASAYGHLFLNLSGNVVMSAGVLGSSVEQTGQTLCGRIIPELKAMPPLPLWRRVINTGRLLHYCLSAPAVVERFSADLDRFAIEKKSDSTTMWKELAAKSWFFDHCMAVHIQSSALSGFLCSIIENRVSGNANDSTIQEQAEAVRLLAGATGVESALMLEQLDHLLDHIADHPRATGDFVQASVPDALSWLHSIPALQQELAAFLDTHGHRGYRELCLRDPSWKDDPAPLVQSMQAAVHGRQVTGGHRALQTGEINWSELGKDLRWLLPKAHNAIRRREQTKSQLVDLAHRFKQGFRHLGRLMAAEGLLPDADLVNFFSTGELPGFIAQPQESAVNRAHARREALIYQQQLEFPEISVGMPQPLQPQAITPVDGALQGRPASRGSIEGIARVAHTLAEASQLQPGEILITPITDIGWTPYFSLIGGLITDLGSSVSHGAVIAREYGLPCVVNTRQATRYFQTGDHIRLDGDTGSVTLLDRK
ncbi:pyruvate, water dikinase [Kineobactrum sediminis]|uniref:Pyruvate, water dikinase n=1 Tax=Kineobactrum sediminis TaxID=1905677 RepID=A0A2N5Y5S9_9GAMM|nr:PEP/pyruvate-binding domain-containing protein [Kineobactrum sediminis]PLW83750.1 pyruvate, water dikinase [Kineobactrum sediminis]